MDLDSWVRHRAMIMAASGAVPPSELRPPPHLHGGSAASQSSPFPGLSRLSAKVSKFIVHWTIENHYPMVYPRRRYVSIIYSVALRSILVSQSTEEACAEKREESMMPYFRESEHSSTTRHKLVVYSVCCCLARSNLPICVRSLSFFPAAAPCAERATVATPALSALVVLEF